MRVKAHITDAARILEHGDTPAAYTEWREYLPLLGQRDTDYILQELTFSGFAASEPLGCARRRFSRMLLDPNDALLDRWMQSLARTPADDFRDFHIPWLRNLKQLRNPEHTASFLDCYEAGLARPSSVRPPESLIVELTRSCNYACGMCSSRTNGYRQEFTMPLDEFGEYIRVLGPTARTLRINGYGETTVIPNLPNYVACLDHFKYAGQREIITNLSGPEDCYEMLSRSGFFIFGSWDGHTAEIFESLRAGADFGVVNQNLRKLASALRSEPYKLNLIFTVQRANLQSILPVCRMALELEIGLVLFNMVNEEGGSRWMEERADEIRGIFTEAAKLAEGTRTSLRFPDHIGSAKYADRRASRTSGTRCDRPWREALINFDGEMTCCNMFNPFSYGMVRHPNLHLDTAQRFTRLWNGPNASFFRKSINLSRPHPYCQGCYFLYPHEAEVARN